MLKSLTKHFKISSSYDNQNKLAELYFLKKYLFNDFFKLFYKLKIQTLIFPLI